jgi:hypothetical protein
MSFEARVDADIIFHDTSEAVFEVGVVSDHQQVLNKTCETITGSATTTPADITASSATTLSTLAIKNTGSVGLIAAGVITIPAGRTAVLPVTSTVSIESASGTGQYTAIWVG